MGILTLERKFQGGCPSHPESESALIRTRLLVKEVWPPKYRAMHINGLLSIDVDAFAEDVEDEGPIPPAANPEKPKSPEVPRRPTLGTPPPPASQEVNPLNQLTTQQEGQEGLPRAGRQGQG